MLHRYPATNIYALDISSLDPDQGNWKKWLGPERIAALSRLRKKKDRSRCTGAGLLLAYVIKKHAPEQAVPPLTAADVNGKPYLPALPEFQFNISHSGRWVICGAGNKPLGVDIESIQRDISAVARRFFSPDELASLHGLPQDRQQAALIEIWTLKESYMKATGLGLRLPLKELEVRLDPEVSIGRKGVSTSCAAVLCDFDDQDYRLALTVEGAVSAPSYALKEVKVETILNTEMS